MHTMARKALGCYKLMHMAALSDGGDQIKDMCAGVCQGARPYDACSISLDLLLLLQFSSPPLQVKGVLSPKEKL